MGCYPTTRDIFQWRCSRLKRLGLTVAGKEMPDKGRMTGFPCRVLIGQARRFENRLKIFRKIGLDPFLLQLVNMLQQFCVANV